VHTSCASGADTNSGVGRSPPDASGRGSCWVAQHQLVAFAQPISEANCFDCTQRRARGEPFARGRRTESNSDLDPACAQQDVWVYGPGGFA
jgi:hypothetical protein